MTCPYCNLHNKEQESDEACTDCLATEIDKRVRLTPYKKARCGHVSFNYFYCSPCKRAGQGKEERNEFSGLAKKVRAWDVESLSYDKPKRRPGDALRNKPRLGKGRGYSYDKKRGNYMAKFRGVFLGSAATAEQAREIYMKAVTAYQEEQTKKENAQ